MQVNKKKSILFCIPLTYSYFCSEKEKYMRKTYRDIRTNPAMAEEPVATYNVSSKHLPSSKDMSDGDSIKANTVSVDEYFDELISLVHKDCAGL